MTLEDAKRVIYGNVIWACQKADFSPFTIDMVKDACETVIALAEKADTPQTEPQIYGNKHNCIMTMFGECSYENTGCGDCEVIEKVRKALEQMEKSCHKPESLYYRAYCSEPKEDTECRGCEFWY